MKKVTKKKYYLSKKKIKKKTYKKKYCLGIKKIKNMCKKTCKKFKLNNKKIQYGCKKLSKGGAFGFGPIDNIQYTLDDAAKTVYNTVLGNDQEYSSNPTEDQFLQGQKIH